MKKITILSLHLNYGGIEKYLSSLCKMLENDYIINLIITYKMNEKPVFSFSNKINIAYLIDDSPNKNEFKRAIKRKKPIKIIKEGIKSLKILYLKRKRTIEAIKNIDADYLITTRLYETKLVNKLLKKSKIKKIATEHNEPSKKYLKRLCRNLKYYDKLIVVNNEIQKDYQKEIGNKVITIPNFLDDLSDEVSPLNNKNIISIGRLEPVKGFIDLIETMSEIVKEDNDIHLTLIGDGSEKDKIIDKIKEKKLENNVELTGFLNQQQIKEYLLNSSLYVMTSINESFGLVLLEAMNYALPIVSFDSSTGAKELLNDDTGVLIKNRNIKKLKDVVIKLLNDKTMLKNYSLKSLKKVKTFDIDVTRQKWKELFKELNNKKGKKVMFISSSGGHLNELLMLKEMFDKYDYSLLTEKTMTSWHLKDKYGNKKTHFLLYGTRKKPLLYPFVLLCNCFVSLYYYFKIKPKFIITTGSHTAGPMCCIGKIFGTKIIFIETFANRTTKSATGKIIYKFADLFIVQWESMTKIYDKAEYGGWIY